MNSAFEELFISYHAPTYIDRHAWRYCETWRTMYFNLHSRQRYNSSIAFSNARHSSSLAQSLSQPPLGSSYSLGPAPRTSNYHYLSTFLSVLTPLCTSHPNLFYPHLVSLLTFLPALILPPVNCGLHRQWVDLSLEIEV